MKWLLLMLSAAPAPKLVEVAPRVEGVVVELRYATEHNFMKQAVYPPQSRCLLLEPAVEALKKAAQALKAKGYRLKLWDCYRPFSVQKKMWEVIPQVGYVADPNKGGSNHNRGAAVDLTLLTLDEKPVEMPTEFDSFTRQAHTWVDKGVSPAARAHRDLLKRAMQDAGFQVNPMEWWHYDLADPLRFPLRDESTAPGS